MEVFETGVSIMSRHPPKTLDEKIASLVPEVDETLRTELQQLLRTLRDAGNPIGVLLGLGRLGLLLLNEVLAAVGEKRPSDNLWHCILRASSGSAEKPKIEGLHILPDEMATYLHTIRTLSNKADHVAEKVTLTVADAENALNLFLRVLEWFYYESEHGPHLKSIYSAESAPPITLQTELERLRQHLIAEGQRRRGLERETIIGLRFADVSSILKDRVDEISQLRRLLGDRTVKLICIVGRGGIGKTALLSKLCAEIEGGELRLSDMATSMGADGIIYISCRGTDNPTVERLFSYIGRMLGDPHAEELMQCWKDTSRSLTSKVCFLLSKLREGCYLLVLDNLEDVLAPDNSIADAELRTFVDLCLATPHALRLIATSREPVEVSEQVLRARRLLFLDRLNEADAVTLLRDLDPDGELGLRNAPEALLLDAARRCYGIPRALEKIAGILSSDPTLTLERLLRDERIFTQQVVENLISEHYCRINNDQRHVLEALAVYNNPMPAVAVRYLLAPFFPNLDVDGCLRTLVRNYFVTYHRERDTYELHPLDRQYVYAHIPDEGGDYTKRACHRRAAEFYRQLQKPQDEWKGLDDVQPQLAEFHHLVLAADYEQACHLLNQIDPHPLATWGYYQLIAEMRERLVDKLEDPRLQELNWGNLGLAVFNLGQAERALHCFERSLQIARDLGDATVIASRIGNIGEVYFVLGETEKAVRYFEEAWELFSQMGQKGEAGFWLGHIGLAYSRAGCMDKAAEYFELAASIAREVGDRQREGSWLSNLGSISLRKGEVSSALNYYTTALQIAREVNDRRGLIARLCGLAYVLRALGRVKDAIDYYQEALTIAGNIKTKYGEARALLGLGQLYHEIGQLDKAKSCLSDALAMDIPEINYKCSVRLGILCLEEGDHRGAQDYFERTISMCQALLERTPNSYEPLYALALAQVGSGRPDEALTTYRKALEVCAAQGVVRDALEDLRLLQRAAVLIEGIERALKELELTYREAAM
jgi:tetratricopeptide (TPR) repeat protein